MPGVGDSPVLASETDPGECRTNSSNAISPQTPDACVPDVGRLRLLGAPDDHPQISSRTAARRGPDGSLRDLQAGRQDGRSLLIAGQDLNGRVGVVVAVGVVD